MGWYFMDWYFIMLLKFVFAVSNIFLPHSVFSGIFHSRYSCRIPPWHMLYSSFLALLEIFKICKKLHRKTLLTEIQVPHLLILSVDCKEWPIIPEWLSSWKSFHLSVWCWRHLPVSSFFPDFPEVSPLHEVHWPSHWHAFLNPSSPSPKPLKSRGCQKYPLCGTCL